MLAEPASAVAYFMVVSEWLGSLSHAGEPCNVTYSDHTYSNMTYVSASNSSYVHGDEEEPETHTYFAGVGLSIVADVIIAVALCIQKYAHNNNKGADGQPVKSYLRIPTWWVGILLNIGGEAGNMLAYGLAPAAVVAPVGSVGVVVNEIIAVTFLKEPLRMRDVVGLFFIIGGVVLVIVTVPESNEQLSVHHLLSQEILFNPRAYWYLIGLLLGIIFFICYLEPRYAQERILVWLLLCSSISSMTVAACRGFASLITLVPSECFAGHGECHHGVLHPPCTQTLGHGLFWTLLAAIIITAVWSAMYLNKAMMVYGNTEVVPVYYCTFTLMSIIGGSLVYNELGAIDTFGAVLFGCGVLLAFGGVGLLMSGHAPTQAKPKKISRKEDVEMDEPSCTSADADGPPAPPPGTHTPTLVRLNTGHKAPTPPPPVPKPLSDARQSRTASSWVVGGGAADSDAMAMREISFRELELEEKIIALENQPSSSQLSFGGSLVQATSGTLLASGREVALLHMESANFPNNLGTAKRLKSSGRLHLGAVTKAVFGAVTMSRDAGRQASDMMSPRQRVIPLAEVEEGGAPQVEGDGASSSAIEAVAKL